MLALTASSGDFELKRQATWGMSAKTALITGVTGQDGSYLVEVRCAGEPGKRLTL